MTNMEYSKRQKNALKKVFKLVADKGFKKVNDVEYPDGWEKGYTLETTLDCHGLPLTTETRIDVEVLHKVLENLVTISEYSNGVLIGQVVISDMDGESFIAGIRW